MKKYAQLKSEKDFLEWHLAILKKQPFFRIASNLFFIGIVPLYLIALVPFLLAGLFFREIAKRGLIKWLKAYCRFMFKCQHISAFKAKDVKAFTKPAVILMLRKDPLQALFIFAHLKEQVLLPLAPKETRPWKDFFISRIILNALLPLCAYPDQHFPFTQARINRLLTKGYHVIAYLNHDRDHRFLKKEIVVSKSCIPFLIDLKENDNDIIFCHIINWEQRISAAWNRPVVFGVEWVDFKNLFNEKMIDENFPIVFTRKILLVYKREGIVWEGA